MYVLRTLIQSLPGMVDPLNSTSCVIFDNHRDYMMIRDVLSNERMWQTPKGCVTSLIVFTVMQMCVSIRIFHRYRIFEEGISF